MIAIFFIFQFSAMIIGQTAECAVSLSVSDTDGKPMSGMMFQVFSGRPDIDASVAPIRVGNIASDKIDNDGDGKADETGEEFIGYATNSEGKLNLNLKDGSYTFAGYSQEKHILTVKEINAPGSFNISASDTVPVSISCRDIDDSPIIGAEVFFRPTKRARASLGYTNNDGLIKARISKGIYNAVLWSVSGRGPHYLVLPHAEVPSSDFFFHVKDLPVCEIDFILPKSFVSIFEVLESTYTNEYAEGLEPEIGYDAAYTDFYPLIDNTHPYTLSADMEYNFNMSFALSFDDKIYAYEIRPALHRVLPGNQSVGITESNIFKLNVQSDPVYHPGDQVRLRYYFRDAQGNILNRILNFKGARLVFPNVTVWDPYGTAIANNFDAINFFEFSFQLPESASIGEYKSDISLDAGIYGKISDIHKFKVQTLPDTEPPGIDNVSVPSELEAGDVFIASARIKDNNKVSNSKIKLFTDKQSLEVPLIASDNDIYQANCSLELFLKDGNPGEVKWQITALDISGKSSDKSGIIRILDTSPPAINHQSIKTSELGMNLLIQANVTDNLMVSEVTLYYSLSDGDSSSMKLTGKGSSYSAFIPGEEITYNGLSYHISANDISGNTSSLPEQQVVVVDTMSPIITHSPIQSLPVNSIARITALITDNSGTVNAKLFFRSPLDQDYRTIIMSKSGGSYYAEIPSEFAFDYIKYHIAATDGADTSGKTRTTIAPSADDDYTIKIISTGANDLAEIKISTDASPLEITVGESIRFTATGYNKSGDVVSATVAWLSDSKGYIDQSGLFLPYGQITGVSKVMAVAINSKSLIVAESYIKIKPGSPANILLNPSSVILPAGISYKFIANVADLYGNPLDDVCSWTIEPKDVGFEPDDSTCTIHPNKSGRYRLTAKLDELTAFSDIVIVPGALSKISVNADKKTIVAGSSLKFIATGYDSFDNSIALSPRWSVRGGIGTINDGGLFTGGSAGTGMICATVGSVIATMNVEVISGQLHHISVNPYAVYLPLSTDKYKSTQQFTVDGWDIANNPVPLAKVTWRTDALAGTITSSGLFTAITDPGIRIGEVVTNGTVYATGTSDAGKSAAGTAYIVIQKSAVSQISSISVVIRGASVSASASLAAGESAIFEAVGFDSLSRSILINPQWSVSGDIGYIDTNGLFTATKPGSGEVIATALGYTGKVSVRVTSGNLCSLVLTPDMLFMSPGMKNTIITEGFDCYDNNIPISNVEWSIADIDITMKPDGTTCLIKMGSGEARSGIISAKVGNITAYANVSNIFSDASISDSMYPLPDAVREYIKVEPDIVLVKPGANQLFIARILDILGNEKKGSITWEVIGNNCQIDNNGLFSFNSEAQRGECCQIIATDGYKTGVSIACAGESAAVNEIMLLPSDSNVTAGESQKFFALARYNDGLFMPADIMQWRLNGNIGRIIGPGELQADKVGIGNIEAQSGLLKAKADIAVQAGTPAKIEIADIYMKSSEQQKPKVLISDLMGNNMDLKAQYQLTFPASLSENGIISASKEESGILTASLSRNSQKMGRANVIVSVGELISIEIIPDSQIVSAGNFIRYTAIGKDISGNIITIGPVWDIQANSQIGSISQNGLFISDKSGKGSITARVGDIVGYASLEVVPSSPYSMKIEPSFLSISSQSIGKIEFKAKFYDIRGNAVNFPEGEILWSVTEGIGAIDRSGYFTNKVMEQSGMGYVSAKVTIGKRILRGLAAVILQPIIKPLAVINISPDNVSIIKGETIRFSAIGRNSDGVELDISPEWHVIGKDSEIKGAISTDGTFEASPEMKIGSDWKIIAIVLNSEKQTIQGEARVSLISGALSSIDVRCDPSCINPIISGDLLDIFAIGYDRHKNQIDISPGWSIKNQIGRIIPSGSKARFVAGLAGSGEIVAAVDGKEGKVHISVIPGQLHSIQIATDPPQLDKIGTDKDNPMIVKSGYEISFKATGYDSNIDKLGNTKPVNIVVIEPEWSVRTEREKISWQGKFIGKEIGDGIIEARSGSVASQFYIKVMAGDLALIKISPSSVSLIPGDSQVFTAYGYDKYGNIISDIDFSWESGGNIGTIDNQGVFTSISQGTGTGTVSASYRDVVGMAFVTIAPAIGELSKLVADIEPSIIGAGGSAIFSVRGFDNYGNPVSISGLSVASSLGILSSSESSNVWIFQAEKILPATTSERKGTLKAYIETNEAISTEAYFDLVPGSLNSIAIDPKSIKIAAGEEALFNAKGYDVYGNLKDISVEWTVVGGIGRLSAGNISNEAIFTAITAGNGRIIASSLSIEGITDVAVSPGQVASIRIDSEDMTLSSGESYAFKVIATDSLGNIIANPEVEWSIKGDENVGMIGDDGVFSASKVGKTTIRAVSSIYSDDLQATVVPGAIHHASITVRRAKQDNVLFSSQRAKRQNGESLSPPYKLLSGFEYDVAVQGFDLHENEIGKLESVLWEAKNDIGLIKTGVTASEITFITLFQNHGKIVATVGKVSVGIEIEIIACSGKVYSRNDSTIYGPFGSKIFIPAGAVRDDVEVFISVQRDSPRTKFNFSATGLKRIGYIYSFEPEGMILLSPATISLLYALATDIDEDLLSIYSWDKFQDKWVREGGSTDKDKTLITIESNHLSLFAVIQEEENETVDKLEILSIYLSPNAYFAPDVNRLSISYNLSGKSKQPVDISISIYDIKGRLIRRLIDGISKYPGINTDQWNGTDDSGRIVRNGRYFVVITAEADGEKVSKTKHLAVFR